MNLKVINKTLKEANRKLRAERDEYKDAFADLNFYVCSLKTEIKKLQEKNHGKS
ncbi:hypothetical protein LCGC14_0356160 [marine sediment metagenome]|uniref:Uncharacterized protein n=1 Tax=marine sediment metagenome TaxID=412755 RepID=A0A0F9TF41_9ZZZZ